jgi:hypothetical protein
LARKRFIDGGLGENVGLSAPIIDDITRSYVDWKTFAPAGFEKLARLKLRSMDDLTRVLTRSLENAESLRWQLSAFQVIASLLGLILVVCVSWAVLIVARSFAAWIDSKTEEQRIQTALGRPSVQRPKPEPDAEESLTTKYMPKKP